MVAQAVPVRPNPEELARLSRQRGTAHPSHRCDTIRPWPAVPPPRTMELLGFEKARHRLFGSRRTACSAVRRRRRMSSRTSLDAMADRPIVAQSGSRRRSSRRRQRIWRSTCFSPHACAAKTYGRTMASRTDRYQRRIQHWVPSAERRWSSPSSCCLRTASRRNAPRTCFAKLRLLV